MRIKIQGLSQPNERISLLEGPHRARVVRFEPAAHSAHPCRSATFLILDLGPYSVSAPGSIAMRGPGGGLARCRELPGPKLDKSAPV